MLVGNYSSAANMQAGKSCVTEPKAKSNRRKLKEYLIDNTSLLFPILS